MPFQRYPGSIYLFEVNNGNTKKWYPLIPSGDKELKNPAIWLVEKIRKIKKSLFCFALFYTIKKLILITFFVNSFWMY